MKEEEKGLENGTGPSVSVSAQSSLIEGLKMVIHSRELENRMPMQLVPEHKPLKSALKPSLKPAALGSSNPLAPGSASLSASNPGTPAAENSIFSIFSDNDSLLPHERGGSDFSWIQTQTQEDFLKQKATEVEDEESFLYGNEEPAASSSAPQFTSSAYPSLEGAEFDKIKNILKNVGSNSAEAKATPKSAVLPVSSNPAVHALPALNNPNVRHALESLQSLIKATKEKRAKEKCDRDGSESSQTSGRKMNAEDKLARKTKIESLLKELEGLMKQDGLGFLTPVIGFYCHKCEEFIGDLNTAEKHAAIHRSSGKPQGDKHTGDGKSHQKKDSKKHSQREWKEDEKPPANPTNLYLKEKLQEERMLITVSCGGETAPESLKRERADSSSSRSSASNKDGKKTSKKKKKKHKKNKKKK